MEEVELKIPQKNKKTVKTRKNVKQFLTEYCESSSIQGLNYIIKDISIFERIWWLLVFAVCLGGCTFMIYEIYDKWVASPVLVAFGTKQEPIYKIPFPAVTVCPETKISKDKCFDYTEVLHKVQSKQAITEKEMQYFDYMSLLCKTGNYKGITREKNFTGQGFSEFLYNCQSLNISDTYCTWMDVKIDCDKLFRPLVTDEGLCYTFNIFNLDNIYSDLVQKYDFDKTRHYIDWDVEEGYPSTLNPGVGYPKRAILSGAQNALTMTLFLKKDDIIHSCRGFAYQGMRVSLHMPSRIPRPSQVFFSVGLDRMVTTAVIPSVLSASETVRAYEPYARNCYLSKERHLKYFKLYSQNNCNVECFTNYTLSKCGCVDFHMPKHIDTPICGVTRKKCLKAAAASYTLDMHKENRTAEEKKSRGCDCMPLCVDLNYDFELSEGFWDWKSQAKVNHDTKVLGLVDSHQASTVKVFFKSGFYIPMERNELYGPTDFISNFGGILGLFTGFSLFSVAEIIYFISVRLIENYRRYGHWAGESVSKEILA